MASRCGSTFVVGFLVAELASALLAAGEGSVAFDGFVGGFWTTISDSLDFLRPGAEAGGPLLVSPLLGGIGVKIFHLACEGCERCFAVGFSRLDVCRDV